MWNAKPKVKATISRINLLVKLFSLENDLTKRLILLIVAFTFGFAFHIILFLYLRKKGKLADSDASVKEERTLPYLISTLIYVFGFAILLLYEINIIST